MVMFFLKDDKAKKKSKIKAMLKKHCPQQDTKNIDYIVKLADRWQFQTLDVKKERLKKVAFKITQIPAKTLDNWLHKPYSKNPSPFLALSLDVLIELLEIADTLNYWKTPIEIVEEEQKIKDLIDSIKSFAKLTK